MQHHVVTGATHGFEIRLVAVVAACALAGSCAPSVRLKDAEDIDRATPPAIETSHGMLSPAQSRQVLSTLAGKAGASEILLHHVAVEEAYTDSPLVAGNRVELLRDGPAAYPAMEEAIRTARHHVNLEVYTFTDDEVGHRMADLLIARAKDGLSVNLIYDSVGCMNTKPEFFERLKAGGVKVVEYNPIEPTEAKGDWRITQRDHRKLLVVDDRVAFTGGINISTEYSGTTSSGGSASFGATSSGGSTADKGAGMPPWRDTHVRIEGPVVDEFQKLFRQTWEKQHGPALPWQSYFKRVPAAGSEIVRAVGTTADEKTSLIHTTLLSAIEHAERSVHLTQAYFVPDEELLQALEKAARRGVDVRLVLPGEPSEGFWLPRFAGRSRFSALLGAGVRIYERDGQVLHAKTAVIDGVWSTVGSANFDYRSLATNDEVNAVILGEGFAGSLEALFQDDLSASRAITKHDWGRRGAETRVKEIVGRVWERWL